MFWKRPLTDLQIVDRVLAGDTEAFGGLVERYGSILHNVAYAHLGDHADAEDATQDVLIKAFTSLDKLRANSLGPWLIAVLRNRCFDVLRRKRLGEVVVQISAIGTPATVEATHEDEELFAILHAEIQRLNPDDREVLALFYMSRKPLREIASILGISKAAASKRLQRAREAVGHRMVDRLGTSKALDTVSKDRAAKVQGVVIAMTVPWQQPTLPSIPASTLAVSIAGAILTKKLVVVCGLFIFGLALMWFGAAALRPKPIYTPIAHRPPVNESESRENGTVPTPTKPESSEAAPEVNSEDEVKYGVLRGRVVNEEGKPQTGAIVTLKRGSYLVFDDEAVPPLEMSTESDANGNYVLEKVPIVVASRTIFPRHRLIVQAETPIGYAYVNDLQINLMSQQAWVELVLHPRALLGGIVVDEAGTPIEAAIVTTANSGAKSPSRQIPLSWHADRSPVTTDSDGRFVFDRLWTGDYRIVAGAKGFNETQTAFYPAGTLDARVVLHKGASIEGTLIDGISRNPVPGVEVRAYIENGSTNLVNEHTDKTDAEGHFRIDDLPAGLCVVLPIQRGFTYNFALPHATLKVPLINGQAVAGLELILQAYGGVTGRVFDSSSGEGIAKTPVSVYSAERPGEGAYVLTDEGGCFDIPQLSAAVFTIEVQPRGIPQPFPKKEIEIRAGQVLQKVDFPVDRKFYLAGRVVSSNGEPLPSAQVIARPNGDSRRVVAQTEADGAFIVYIPEQWPDVVVQATHESEVSAVAGPLELIAHADTNISLQIEAAGAISGEVVSRNGRPLAGMNVRAEPDSASSNVLWNDSPKSSDGAHDEQPVSFAPETITGAGGTFYLSKLRASTYTLRVTRKGDANSTSQATQAISLAAGQTKSDVRLVVDLPDAPTGTVTGTVTFLGKPVELANVAVNQKQVTTDVQGNYRVEGVPAGEISVGTTRGVPEDGFEVRREVRKTAILSGGSSVRVDLELAGGTATLEGVVRVNGHTAGLTDVVVGDAIGRTNEKGEYRITGLPEGTQTATAMVLSH
ncbi:MAG: sigma-70 family RNA polymerase sigma factor [Candidatus Hydrogenedentes bacterium]|nr:sigma-70 family RNA polymerase sigma factor [Candidatus Hydrogenedentota bacterium]